MLGFPIQSKIKDVHIKGTVYELEDAEIKIAEKLVKVFENRNAVNKETYLLPQKDVNTYKFFRKVMLNSFPF